MSGPKTLELPYFETFLARTLTRNPSLSHLRHWNSLTTGTATSRGSSLPLMPLDLHVIAASRSPLCWRCHNTLQHSLLATHSVWEIMFSSFAMLQWLQTLTVWNFEYNISYGICVGVKILCSVCFPVMLKQLYLQLILNYVFYLFSYNETCVGVRILPQP